MMRMLGYAKCPYPAQNSREVLYCNYKSTRARAVCTMCVFMCVLLLHSPLIDKAKNEPKSEVFSKKLIIIHDVTPRLSKIREGGGPRGLVHCLRRQ